MAFTLDDRLNPTEDNVHYAEAVPFARLNQALKNADNVIGMYTKKANHADAFNTDPRSIIRDDRDVFPIDVATPEQIKKLKDIQEARTMAELGDVNYDASKEAIRERYRNSGTADDVIPKSSQEIIKRKANDHKVIDEKYLDYNALMKAKKEGKELGQQIAKQFATENNKEKAMYRNIAADVNPNTTAIPDDYAGKIYKVTNKRDGSSTMLTEDQLKSLNQDAIDENIIEEAKPVKALGGQNTKYLNGALEPDDPQTLGTMAKSAKPIHYDENGKPFVRGYTWTQTDNISKITDPNGGYLASVGADTRNYHPDATPGQWTSEGWGNPMDKNYENGVRPGEVEEKITYNNNGHINNPRRALREIKNLIAEEEYQNARNLIDDLNVSDDDVDKAILDLYAKYNIPTSKNFNEQLLGTKYSLKDYNKHPTEHQPDHGEKVTVFNAKPGAKDVHRPIYKKVHERTEAGRDFDALGAKYDVKYTELEKRYDAGDLEKFEYDLEKAKLDNEAYKEMQKLHEKYGINADLGKDVMKPVGTQVNKIATPSSKITAYLEDNMPKGWSMRDGNNGGHTIAGFHPNKPWAGMNAEEFTKEALQDPEIAKMISDQKGIDVSVLPYAKVDREMENLAQQWFIEHPNEYKRLVNGEPTDWDMHEFIMSNPDAVIKSVLDNKELSREGKEAALKELYKKQRPEVPEYFKSPYDFVMWRQKH